MCVFSMRARKKSRWLEKLARSSHAVTADAVTHNLGTTSAYDSASRFETALRDLNLDRANRLEVDRLKIVFGPCRSGTSP